MAKHRTPRNPLRLVPVLTLAGLAFAGGVSVSAYGGTPHTALSVAQSAPASIRLTQPTPKLSEPQKAPEAVAVLVYTVRPGDNLSQIAEAHCGTASDWTKLRSGNHLASTVINPGEILELTC